MCDKQIHNLRKQNEGIESSLRNRNIPFNKMSIDITSKPELELEVVRGYNTYLKEIAKQSKPPSQPAQPQPAQPMHVKDVKDVKEEKEEPDYEEEKIVYKPNVSLEDTKRAFFSKEYPVFETLLNDFRKEDKVKFYKANYKWADEKLGKPEFIAKNQVRGFIQTLDSYRKYLMVCFRCIMVDIDEKRYRFPSYWIVNADTDIKTLLGSIYDDFDFIEVNDDTSVAKLLHKMRKNEDENDTNLVSEVYLN